jgi:hypothetical protein
LVLNQNDDNVYKSRRFFLNDEVMNRKMKKEKEKERKYKAVA